MSPGEVPRTLRNWLTMAPGSGLGTTVQPEPFQCSVRVATVPLPVWEPTAQASQADSIATLSRVLLRPPGLGGWVPVQFWQPAGAASARARPKAVIAPASIST